MNASERLQSIIKERLEGETFGWGLILTVWAGVIALRMGTEILTGPTLIGESLAWGGLLVFQVLWSRRRGAPQATRSWTLQGLWLLVAVAAWFFGAVAPGLALLSVPAGAVLELLFLAGGLTLTGIMKSRPSLWIGGLALMAGSVFLATFPFLLPGRMLLLAVAFGVPAFLAFRVEKH